MKYSLVVAGVIVVGLVAGGTWWMLNSMDKDEQSTSIMPTTTEESELPDTQTEGEEDAEEAVTISYTDKGFSASADTVPAGSTVLVVNASSETLEFSSDPHPQHTDNSELNLPALQPGEQETMVVEKSGEWGFHNHLNDDHSGSITVTD